VSSVTTAQPSFPRPNIRFKLAGDRNAPRLMPLKKNRSAWLRRAAVHSGGLTGRRRIGMPKTETPYTRRYVIWRVESRTGAVAVASRWLVGWAFALRPQSRLAWLCFLFPLIEPDSDLMFLSLSRYHNWQLRTVRQRQ
jgi:hypothetical protein